MMSIVQMNQLPIAPAERSGIGVTMADITMFYDKSAKPFVAHRKATFQVVLLLLVTSSQQ